MQAWCLGYRLCSPQAMYFRGEWFSGSHYLSIMPNKLADMSLNDIFVYWCEQAQPAHAHRAFVFSIYCLRIFVLCRSFDSYQTVMKPLWSYREGKRSIRESPPLWAYVDMGDDSLIGPYIRLDPCVGLAYRSRSAIFCGLFPSVWRTDLAVVQATFSPVPSAHLSCVPLWK